MRPPVRFGSSFSGIEAASVAFKPLGWEPAWFAENAKFPSAVLAHHYPDIPNHGDVCLLPERILNCEIESPAVFVGGSPCQGFSVSGKRLSLEDLRSNLCLTFCEIADAIDTVRAIQGREPCVIFWEQVPGVLSVADNAFGCFLGRIAGEDMPLQPPGERWTNAGCVIGPKRTLAWGILDAQYFGLAQRRERVFVVASAREGFDPAQILLIEEGGRRDYPPRRSEGKGIAADLVPSLTGSGRGVERCGESRGQDPVVACPLTGSPYGDNPHDRIYGDRGVMPALTQNNQAGGLNIAHCPDVSPAMKSRDHKGVSSDGDGDGLPLVAMAFSCKNGGQDAGDVSPTLRSMNSVDSNQNGGGQVAVAFQTRIAMDAVGQPEEICPTLSGADAGETSDMRRTVAYRSTGSTGTYETGECIDTLTTGQDPNSHMVVQTDMVSHALRGEGHDASEDGTGRGTPIVPVMMNGADYANAEKTDSAQTLRAVRKEIGEEAFAEWGLGMLISFQEAEVLRREMHGEELRREASNRQPVLGDRSLSCEKDLCGWCMRNLRKGKCEGCRPQGWKLSKQLSRKFTAYVSKLSQQKAQTQTFLCDLWIACEGTGALRETLLQVQETRRPSQDSGQKNMQHVFKSGEREGVLRKALHANETGGNAAISPQMAVRRLMPVETERLQGFPDNYTKVPYRSKPAEKCPDGPRYCALGNSWPVPVVSWIGQRIDEYLKTDGGLTEPPAVGDSQ